MPILSLESCKLYIRNLRDTTLEYVHYSTPASSGACDLVAFFVRRFFDLLKDNGITAFISTNTIAQGDTRKSSLEYINTNKGKIVFAVRSIRWPGRAAVDVSLLSIQRGESNIKCVLDGAKVTNISSFLSAEEDTSIHKLSNNADRCSIGCYALGKGFVLGTDEASSIIQISPNNSDVILPYLNGDDINSRPDQQPSRYTIFFFDWSEEVSATYKAPFGILIEKVYPIRTKDNRKAYRERWWQFAEKRPKLLKNLEGREVFYACSRVTKYFSLTRYRVGIIPSEATVVFTIDGIEAGVLSSSFHEHWAWKNCSRMGDSTLRYTPSSAFDTFPFPTQSQRVQDEMEKVFSQRLIIQGQLNIGLTLVLNLFHAPDLSPELVAKVSKKPADEAEAGFQAILKLRELHRELDQAVLAAYGWADLDLGHDFHDLDYLPENDRTRYTISPAARREVLQRLLKLNHERHAEEKTAAEAEKAKKPKKKAAKKPVKKKPSEEGANIYFRRTVLAAEIIDRLHKENTFGHVKFEKVIFLTERMLNVDFDSNYHRDAAGPYDNRALRSIDSQIKKLKWYAPVKVDKRYQYQPLEKAGSHKQYFDNWYGDKEKQFSEIIELVRGLKTEHCEIIATLYSAWEDFLRSGKRPSDEEIVNEVRTNWHESKAAIEPDRWHRALKWMREKGVVPGNSASQETLLELPGTSRAVLPSDNYLLEIIPALIRQSDGSRIAWSTFTDALRLLAKPQKLKQAAVGDDVAVVEQWERTGTQSFALNEVIPVIQEIGGENIAIERQGPERFLTLKSTWPQTEAWPNYDAWLALRIVNASNITVAFAADENQLRNSFEHVETLLA